MQQDTATNKKWKNPIRNPIQPTEEITNKKVRRRKCIFKKAIKRILSESPFHHPTLLSPPLLKPRVIGMGL